MPNIIDRVDLLIFYEPGAIFGVQNGASKNCRLEFDILLPFVR